MDIFVCRLLIQNPFKQPNNGQMWLSNARWKWFKDPRMTTLNHELSFSLERQRVKNVTQKTIKDYFKTTTNV